MVILFLLKRSLETLGAELATTRATVNPYSRMESHHRFIEYGFFPVVAEGETAHIISTRVGISGGS